MARPKLTSTAQLKNMIEQIEQDMEQLDLDNVSLEIRRKASNRLMKLVDKLDRFPTTKISVSRREGFWYSVRETWLPIPIPQILTGDQMVRITQAIKKVEAEARRVFYRGFSYSRITGELLGCQEYTLDGWTWPGDFCEHYVRRYRVAPSDEFLEWLGFDTIFRNSIKREAPIPTIVLHPKPDQFTPKQETLAQALLAKEKRELNKRKQDLLEKANKEKRAARQVLIENPPPPKPPKQKKRKRRSTYHDDIPF